jgi:hypothetical protein
MNWRPAGVRVSRKCRPGGGALLKVGGVAILVNPGTPRIVLAHRRSPCDSVILRLMESPMPVPSGLVRLKDALRASFGKTSPGIAHGNKQLTILRPRRGNAQFAALLLHGLDAVMHEIH